MCRKAVPNLTTILFLQQKYAPFPSPLDFLTGISKLPHESFHISPNCATLQFQPTRVRKNPVTCCYLSLECATVQNFTITQVLRECPTLMAGQKQIKRVQSGKGQNCLPTYIEEWNGNFIE